MINRQVFSISASGGVTGGDTGRLEGGLLQFRWYPDAVDTGQSGTLALALFPIMADTGSGWTIYSEAGVNLGVGFNRAPRQATHDANGAVDQTDTGTPAAPTPIVGSGDRLSARIAPTDTGNVIAGKLYVWSEQAVG